MAQTLTTQEPAGLVTVGKTTYRVYRLDVAEASRAAGVENRFGLEGPRGATFLVTDYGRKYRINSVALGGGTSWQASPRELRGLTREHLAAFGVEP